ncbi:MAG TPA: extracellular solute-binding protein, partial [Polyangiaceae bacterium]|nr:extracellular solute-binding protein [Polyangiaceae bacterium]
LTWYINPDNGGQAELAERCAQASGGKYQIEIATLPNDATSQREQLVRRLAARDTSIDLMSLDPPFVAELATAGFLRPFNEQEARALTEDVLAGPLASAKWDGKLFAAPFWANTQLLWFRRSIVERSGIDPDKATWSDLVRAATATGSSLEVQGRRYEGYMVWINALVASAGGSILLNPEAGKSVKPGIDSEAGVIAATIIHEVASASIANPALSTADEEAGRAVFQSARGGFMVNWPYVYGAAAEGVASGALSKAVMDDIGWARYPRSVADKPSRPPLGGIHLAVSSFSRHSDLAVEAVRCITSAENQRRYMIGAKLPAARSKVYDDPEVRQVYPMADLIRDSINDAAPRPVSPYYTDVSAAVVRSFHPPIDVDPKKTPAEAAKLIVDVLNDLVLL